MIPFQVTIIIDGLLSEIKPTFTERRLKEFDMIDNKRKQCGKERKTLDSILPTDDVSNPQSPTMLVISSVLKF